MRRVARLFSGAKRIEKSFSPRRALVFGRKTRRENFCAASRACWEGGKTGAAGLQTKFDQNYLPQLNVFRIKVDISERKELAESNLKLFLKWTRAGNDQFNSPFYARAHTRSAGTSRQNPRISTVVQA